MEYCLAVGVRTQSFTKKWKNHKPAVAEHSLAYPIPLFRFDRLDNKADNERLLCKFGDVS